MLVGLDLVSHKLIGFDWFYWIQILIQKPIESILVLNYWNLYYKIAIFWFYWINQCNLNLCFFTYLLRLGGVVMTYARHLFDTFRHTPSPKAACRLNHGQTTLLCQLSRWEKENSVWRLCYFFYTFLIRSKMSYMSCGKNDIWMRWLRKD